METSEIKAKEMAPQRLSRMEEVDFKYCNLKRECNTKWGFVSLFLSLGKQDIEPQMRKIRSKNNASFSFLLGSSAAYLFIYSGSPAHRQQSACPCR